MKYHKSRKADLSLSINSIVILVLAITMLALGLSFIKGLLPKVTKQVEERISKEPEPTTPTDLNPISLSRDPVIASKGEDVVIKIAVLCKIDDADDCANPVLSLSCSNIGATGGTGGIAALVGTNFNTLPSYGAMSYSTTKTGIGLFKVADLKGLSVCTVSAADGQIESGRTHSTQFQLEIK